MALVEGYEYSRQAELAPLRLFVTAICNSNGSKVKQQQILALPLIDDVGVDDKKDLVEKILNYARNRKKNGSGIKS